MPMPSGGSGTTDDAQHCAEVWKTTSTSAANVEQHRLRCSLAEGMQDNMQNGKAFESSFDTSAGSGPGAHGVREQLTELRSAVKLNQTLQWITMGLILFISIAVVYIIKFEIKNNSYEYCVRQ